MLSNLSKFLQWWWRELSYLLPSRIAETFFGGNQLPTVVLDSGEIISISLPGQSGDGEVSLSDIDSYINDSAKNCQGVLVEVSGNELLQRQVKLPAATAENLTEVLSLEMDRQTPFRADQVFFAHKITSRSADKKHIHVEVSLIPRSHVLLKLGNIAEWTQQADEVVLTDSGLRIKLVPKARAMHTLEHAQLAPKVIAVVLLISLFALPLWVQEMKLIKLHDDLGAIRTATKTAQVAINTIDKNREVLDLLLGQQHDSESVIVVLEKVSQLLPDSTWLKQLDIDSGAVHLHGYSEDASSLLGILEKSDHFEKARFVSPIVRDRTLEREQFEISVNFIIRGASS